MLLELGPLRGCACSLSLVLFVVGPPRVWARSSFACEDRSSFACESVEVHGLHGDCTTAMLSTGALLLPEHSGP